MHERPLLPGPVLDLEKALKTLTRTARFSEDRLYRYDLHRQWDDRPSATFIMCNPSVASAERDDNTVSRCIRFAHRWGCGGLHVANIFALVGTDPACLYVPERDPVGPENDAAIVAAARQSSIVIMACGHHGEHLGRGRAVFDLLVADGHAPQCLGVTKDGYPKHPLARGKAFVPYDFAPVPFVWPS